MKKLRSFFVFGFLALIVLMVFSNPIKNSVNDTSKIQYGISIPDSNNGEITLSDDQITASLFSSNQTDFIQNTLQQNVLTNIHDSNIKLTSFELVPVIEKVDASGTIIDRIKSNPFDLLMSFITNTGNSTNNTNIENQKIRLSLDLKSSDPFQKITLNGILKVLVNEQELTSSTFSVTGSTTADRESNLRFGTFDYYEISYKTLSEKFIDNDINTIKLVISEIKGNFENSPILKSNILVYKSDVDYSQFKILVKNEQGNVEKIYPKDSKIIFSSTGSKKYDVHCNIRFSQSLGGGCYQAVSIWRGEYYSSPVIKGIKVIDSKANVVLNHELLVGTSVEVPISRNEEYHVIVEDPAMDYMIITPKEKGVIYDLSCVGTSTGSECGKPS